MGGGGGGDNSLATFVDLAYDRAEREPLANYRCRLFYYDWSVSQTFDGTALLIACRWGRRSPTFIINYPKNVINSHLSRQTYQILIDDIWFSKSYYRAGFTIRDWCDIKKKTKTFLRLQSWHSTDRTRTRNNPGANAICLPHFLFVCLFVLVVGGGGVGVGGGGVVVVVLYVLLATCTSSDTMVQYW